MLLSTPYLFSWLENDVHKSRAIGFGPPYVPVNLLYSTDTDHTSDPLAHISNGLEDHPNS